MATNSNLLHIHKKVDEIETGLLRFKRDNSQVSLHVRAKSNGENLIRCFFADKADLKKIVPGKVSLIQKSDNNYLVSARKPFDAVPSKVWNFLGYRIIIHRNCVYWIWIKYC